MDPITVGLITVWAVHAGVGLAVVGNKLRDINKKLIDINSAFDSMDFSWRMPELSELDKEHRDGEEA